MIRSIAIFLMIVMCVLSILFLGWSGILRLPNVSVLESFPHVRALVLNRQGNVQFKAQVYDAAFDTYVKTLEFAPFAPEVHLDLGLTYEAQQQVDKAQTSYQNSLLFAKDDSQRFMALFDAAQLLGKAKKVDEALGLYQQALNIDPTSKEVKTNIELLIQQQKSGGGKDDKDQKDNKDQNKDNKDKKDQNKDSKDNKDQKDPKDQDKNQDPKDQKDKDGKDKDKPRQYGENKPQPKKFKSEELSEGDVKKILQELKQQEQKIRSEFNRKEVKEQPRDKDW